jgi:uncharacterized membrane protein
MRYVKVIFSCLFLFLFYINQVVAQEIDNENSQNQFFEKSNLFYGGSLWLSFGSYTNVDVNIVFGSQVSDRWSVGISGKYQYYNDKRSIEGTFESNVFGGSVFSQFALVKDFRDFININGHSGIISHVEYEFLNTEYNYLYFDDPVEYYDRYWLHNMLVGGGYFQRIGPASMSYIILLWNVTSVDKNPYTYPQLRLGFSIGI